MRGTTLQTSRSEQKKGADVLQMPEQRFPSRPWNRLLAGPVERGAHAGAGLLAGLVTP